MNLYLSMECRRRQSGSSRRQKKAKMRKISSSGLPLLKTRNAAMVYGQTHSHLTKKRKEAISSFSSFLVFNSLLLLRKEKLIKLDHYYSSSSEERAGGKEVGISAKSSSPIEFAWTKEEDPKRKQKKNAAGV